jgi:hypothetical protein
MQCPVVVWNVLSAPLLFGIAGEFTENVVEVISLQKLTNSSYSFDSSIIREKIEWAMTSIFDK